MRSPPHPPPALSGSGWRRGAGAWLSAVAAVAFLFFFNTYGVSIFPRVRRPMDPAGIRLLAPGEFAYAYDFLQSEGDLGANWRDRVQLREGGRLLLEHRSNLDEVRTVGGGRWAHPPGRIVFSTSDNSDPRSNGRIYDLAWPWSYRHSVGRASAAALALSLLGLYALNRRRFQPAPLLRRVGQEPPVSRRARWHLLGAALLFLAGLYCNTGTLTPYAFTTFPHVEKTTGYLYNPDHVHFQVLFAFVNNAHRSVWNHALLLRRILFPVLGWPLMRLFGFEIGGTLASLILNVAGLVGFVWWLRRRVGERGAIFAGWLLALSPGAAYWGGLPYPYALIFPGSLLLLAGLGELEEAGTAGRVAWLSLGMGLLYLGYDFTAFFLPASFLLLAWRRRWRTLAITLPLQLLPLALWLAVLKFGLRQPLENSNTGVYHSLLSAYFTNAAGGLSWAGLAQVFDSGCYAFFGANFIFLPGLFLLLAGLNPVTARIRFLPLELSLLLVALGLFLFNNLAPAGGSYWDMHGSWISRIYQPVFPVFVLFAARWWQHLPRLSGRARGLAAGPLLLALAGNALIVFGPIALNPLQVSEFAYYRFYNHIDIHWAYEYNLRQFGRRPLGFPRPQP